jgi:hypothetical protein
MGEMGEVSLDSREDEEIVGTYAEQGTPLTGQLSRQLSVGDWANAGTRVVVTMATSTNLNMVERVRTA